MGQNAPLYLKADSLFEAGKYHEANRICDRLLTTYANQGITTDSLLAKTYRLKGLLSFKAADLPATIAYGQKALQMMLALPDTHTLSIALVQDLLGAAYLRGGNIETALIWQKKALNKRLKLVGPQHKAVANSYRNLSATLIKQNPGSPEALEYLFKALEIRKQHYGENSPKLGATYVGIGHCLTQMGQYAKGTNYLEKGLELSLVHLGANHPNLITTYINLGNSMRMLGDLEGALAALKAGESVAMSSVGPQHVFVSLLHSNMGGVYMRAGEIQKSIRYYQNALRLRVAASGELHPKTAFIYMRLGVGYRKIQQYTKAIELQLKALEINSALYGENHHQTTGTYTSLGNSYLLSGDFEQAEHYLKKALQSKQTIHGENNPFTASAFHNLGNYFYGRAQYDQALFHFEKALEIRQQFNSPKLALTFCLLAEINLDAGQLQKAAHLFEKSRTTLHYSWTTPFQFSNLIQPNHFNMWLTRKAKYFKRRMPDADTGSYSDSLKLLQEVQVRFADYVQSSMLATETDAQWQSNNYSIYEESMDHLFERQNANELPRIFELAEKSKYRRLFENFRSAKARQLANVPAEMLQEKHRLRDSIFWVEQQLEQAVSDRSDWLARQFGLTRRQDELNDQLNEEYPEYVALSKTHEVSPLETVQQQLKANQSLLEYFVGDQHLFILVVSQQDFTVKRIPLDFPLTHWVQDLRSGIAAYWTQPEESDSLFFHYKKQYLTVAHELYEKLVQPVEDQLREQLIIVPDDALYFIPFEALLTTEEAVESPFSKLAYLLHKHEITYALSATLQQQNQKKDQKDKPNEVAAFAPSFPPTWQVDHYPQRAATPTPRSLSANRIECESILETWGGALYADTMASKAQFLATAPNTRMLHLATHAAAFPLKGNHSFIAFTPTADSNATENKLYVNELYHLKLSTELVVLSACETGMGELQKGEGVIGLTRGMLYAGAQSIVSSLWNINDATTQHFMIDFYQQLREGKSKSKALRHTKLSFLEQEKTAAPFFWSAYTLTGNNEPIEEESIAVWQLLFLLVLPLCAIGVWVWRK